MPLGKSGGSPAPEGRRIARPASSSPGRRSAPPSRASSSASSPRVTARPPPMARAPSRRPPPSRGPRPRRRRRSRSRGSRTRGARPRAEVRSGTTPVQEAETKRTRRGAPGPHVVRFELDGAYVRGLRALLALGHVVLDLLVLLQVAETLTGDRAEMHEHVGGTVVRSDEAEALLGAEPLHGSDCHVRSLLSFAVRA